MQQWEYCAVFANGMEGKVMKPHFPTIYYFTSEGTREEQITGKEFHALGKVLAHLGSEGWEMVGTGALARTDAHAIYFKRPLAPPGI